jgi:hypothetical protein
MIFEALTALVITSKVGIGVYTDTTGSPPLAVQLDAARNLTGADGWVVLYLCSWRTTNASCVNESTTGDAASNAALRAAYARNLSVVARIGNPYYVRDHADRVGASALAFTALAKGYARLIASLPAPPRGKALYVTAGNEFNACNEWRCSDAAPNATLSSAQMAAEVGAFYRDVGAAVEQLQATRKYLRYAVGPISDWDTSPCECGTGKPLGAGRSGLKWLALMHAAEPTLYRNADWFCSHAYPYQREWDDPTALQGLTYYRNETTLIGRPGPHFPVLVTETGWRLDARWARITSAERANWTVRAFDLWERDEQLVAAMPFLLSGALWQSMGWSWANVSGVDGSGPLVPLPVYDAVFAMQRARAAAAAAAAAAPQSISIAGRRRRW